MHHKLTTKCHDNKQKLKLYDCHKKSEGGKKKKHKQKIFLKNAMDLQQQQQQH